MNLLTETLEMLSENGKTEDDVLFVIGDNCKRYKSGEDIVYCSWDSFKEISNINYDDGYGSAEINQSIKVVGKDFWLERHEYDGSEWWEFKTMPIKKGREGNLILLED